MTQEISGLGPRDCCLVQSAHRAPSAGPHRHRIKSGRRGSSRVAAAGDRRGQRSSFPFPMSSQSSESPVVSTTSRWGRRGWDAGGSGEQMCVGLGSLLGLRDGPATLPGKGPGFPGPDRVHEAKILSLPRAWDSRAKLGCCILKTTRGSPRAHSYLSARWLGAASDTQEWAHFPVPAPTALPNRRWQPGGNSLPPAQGSGALSASPSL